MIEQLQQFFKNPAKVTRLMILCFFGAVILSGIYLYSLPNKLVYEGGMIDSHRATAVYVKLTVIVGIAFVLAYIAIHYQQRTKQETIVYLDKQTDGPSSQLGGGSSREGSDSFNVAAIRAAVARGKGADEKYQEALNAFCDQLKAGQGALFIVHSHGEKKSLELKSGYALVLAEGEQPSFAWGEGLIGQVAASGKSLYLDELPEGYAARIESGLGSSLPKYLFMLPVKKENEIRGVIEIATFAAVSDAQQERAVDAAAIFGDI